MAEDPQSLASSYVEFEYDRRMKDAELAPGSVLGPAVLSPADMLHGYVNGLREVQWTPPTGATWGSSGDIAYAEWVLAAGGEWPGRALPRPLRRRRHPRGHGSCYANAGRLVMSDPERFRFAEGFAVSPELPIVIQHAWCVDAGGVVDVTWRAPSDCAYIGVETDAKHVAEMISAHGTWGPWGPW